MKSIHLLIPSKIFIEYFLDTVLGAEDTAVNKRELTGVSTMLIVFYYIFKLWKYGFFPPKYYLSPSPVHKADKNNAALFEVRGRGWELYLFSAHLSLLSHFTYVYLVLIPCDCYQNNRDINKGEQWVQMWRKYEY